MTARFPLTEEDTLAPYAMSAAQSRGRRYPEPEHPYRSAFMRDRDRVIHSRAFRRLEYKTQVFVNHEGDHYRTRLTHSIEVSSVGRSLGMLCGEFIKEREPGLSMAPQDFGSIVAAALVLLHHEHHRTT